MRSILITPVMHVPMFAPSTVGYMRSILITPTPTSGVSADVVMDEDCTQMVMPRPMTIDMYPATQPIGMVTAPHLMSGTLPLTDLWSHTAMRPLRSDLSVYTISARVTHSTVRATIRMITPATPS